MKIPDYKHKSLDISSLANQLTPYQSLNRCAWLNTGENKSEPVGLFKTQVVLMAKETKSFFLIQEFLIPSFLYRQVTLVHLNLSASFQI